MTPAAEPRPAERSPRSDPMLRALPASRAVARLEQLDAERGVLVPDAGPDLRALLLREGLAIAFHDGAEPVPAGATLDAVVVDAGAWTAEAWRSWRARHAMEAVPAVVVARPTDDADDVADAYHALEVVPRPLSSRTLARRLRVAAEIGRHRALSVRPVVEGGGRLRYLLGLPREDEPLPPDEDEDEERRLERLAAMGAMVASFAHEVRNPVTAMRSVIDTLDEELPSPDLRRVYLSKLLKHLDRVERLVKSSLTFGRSDAPRRAPALPLQLADDALEQMRPRLGTLGSMHCEVASGLPRIMVDELHFTQILVALLNNALDAAVYPDQVTLRVRLDGGDVCFSVEDHGPGIPRHVLGRMFDPFFTTKPSGSGLGLSIAQRLAHDNGATIEVSSTAGQGAIVQVRVAPISLELK